VHAFDVLGDPVRRRIMELLSVHSECTAGELAEVLATEFGISQPTVSGHLRVLRESGFASVRHQGTRRLYRIDPAPLQEVDRWLEGFRRFWIQPLNALDTELARGRRQRRLPNDAHDADQRTKETRHE
jgi:DNA-binding transcriptional ArsR family regulator